MNHGEFIGLFGMKERIHYVRFFDSHGTGRLYSGCIFRGFGSADDAGLLFSVTQRYLQGFLSDCGRASSCEGKPKLEKASVYVEGLLSHGGPSTDVFLKAMGEEKTAELFRKVLFGTEL